MECPGPRQRVRHGLRARSHNLRRNTLDTTSKFGRRAAGESEKKNAARVGAIDDQVGDSMRQSFGFARPRAGDYKEGRPWVIVDADAVLNRVALLPIEFAEIGGSL